MADGRKRTDALIVIIAMAIVALAGAGVGAALRPGWLAPAAGLGLVAALAGLGAVVGLRWRSVRVRAGIARVRGDLAAVIARRLAAGRPAADDDIDPGMARLVDLVADVGAALATSDARRDDRLAAIIAVLGEAVVVATASGQVSLVSAAAKALLGSDRVAVGTSVYAALDRASAVRAADRAAAAGAPVDAEILLAGGGALAAKVASLGDPAATVYSFAGGAGALGHGVDHDLSLHDRAPAPTPFDDHTALAELPVVVLDLETTGLDTASDRTVSIGAVLARGPRLYRGDVFDRLVAPGIEIPAHSTRIHGITDVMVADAPSYDSLYPEVARLVSGLVVVGHNIGFDLAILAAEAARFDLDWRPPPALDLLRLGAALEPDQANMTLDAMARRWGIAINGRHTALGDALVTAELWASALPRLAEVGVTTFGEALAFEQQAKSVIARQKEVGW